MRTVRSWGMLAFLLGMGACVDEEPRGTLVAQHQVANIRLLGLQTGLPPSATHVWLQQRSWLDSYQMLRFDAPLAEARAFARSVLGREPVAGEDPAFQAFGQDYHWWLHDYPKDAEGGAHSGNGRLIELVLVPKGRQARNWLLISQS